MTLKESVNHFMEKSVLFLKSLFVLFVLLQNPNYGLFKHYTSQHLHMQLLKSY